VDAVLFQRIRCLMHWLLMLFLAALLTGAIPTATHAAVPQLPLRTYHVQPLHPVPPHSALVKLHAALARRWGTLSGALSMAQPPGQAAAVYLLTWLRTRAPPYPLTQRLSRRLVPVNKHACTGQFSLIQ
jgi:hypothetical protein